MFEKILKIITPTFRWLNTKKFPDGSSMCQIGRDEVVYKKADGRSVVMYVFITGGGDEFGRILAKESIGKWSKPDSQEDIPELEQQQIIQKLTSYFNRDNIGLLTHPSKKPIPIEQA